MTWNFYDFYWISWVLLSFGIFEFQALYRGKPEQTFTHFYARTFALFPYMRNARYWRLRRALGSVIPFWLLIHMIFQTVGGVF